MPSNDKAEIWRDAEERRAAALADLRILDTQPEPRFDDLARIAARACDAPIALISFLDRHRQWFKAEIGLGIRETPLDIAICAVTIQHRGVLVVPDLSLDERFAMFPHVLVEPWLRFYAGTALRTVGGVPIGSICVLDHKPRRHGLTPEQQETLLALGRATQDQLELRQANGVLKNTEARYRALISASSSIVWTTSPNGESLDGTAWNEFTGNKPEAMSRDAWMDSVHPEDKAGAAALSRRYRDAGEPYEIEYRLRHASGQYRWAEVRTVPVKNADGEILEWVGTTTDIHERRLTEEALRESEAHYRHAVELNPQIPWTADPSGNILEVGPRWLELMGMTQEETLGRGWDRALHPDDKPGTFANWAFSLAGGQPFHTQYRLRFRDGSYRWMRVRASARRGENGDIIRWYGTCEDIHDHKTAELALKQSEAFARSVLDSSSNAIEVLDLAGHLRFINEAGVRIFEDDDAANVLGLAYETFYSQETRPLLLSALDEARAGRKSRFSIFSPTFKGTPKWWDVAISPILGAGGEVERLLVLSSDITEAKQAETAMAEVNARLSAVLETTMDCVVVLDRNWRITYMNQNAVNEMGQVMSPLGHDLRAVLQDLPISSHLAAVMEQRTSVAFEAHLQARGLWLEVHAAGSHDGLTIFFRNVTEQRQARQQIEHLAYHDALTALPNRALLRTKLLEAVAKGDQTSALLLLDLDDFKSINDAFGHPAGDKLLVEVAKSLQELVGEQSFIARLGGDEFALVLGQSADPGAVAERLVGELQKPIEVNGRLVRTGVSIGLALTPRDGREPDDLFAKADMALYEAKAAGGRTFRQFKPALQERLLAREAMKQDLTEALEKNQLRAVYQPQYSLRTGTIVGFEALLRWEHPRRGSVPPAEFIPLAEETGLINQIGDWILDQACRQAQTWPENISVSVNLSPVQFRNKTLPLRVLKALFVSNLKPGRLKLEVTESVLLQNSQDNLRILEELRALGTKIALDDFGTGYSSLSYLRNFTFNEIKIDRAFTKDIGESRQSEAIIRAVADLGRALQVETTAEGIETLQQQQWLTSAGYDFGQGYYFSRPVSADQASAMLGNSDNDWIRLRVRRNEAS